MIQSARGLSSTRSHHRGSASTICSARAPWRSLGQSLPRRLDRKGHYENANAERNRRQRDRRAERPHPQHQRTEQEIHAGADESAHRRREREGRRANASLVLLGQPQTERRKASAGEAHEKKNDDERDESVIAIERPAERQRNRDHHSREVERDCDLSTQSLGQRRKRDASENRPDRQHPGSD